VEKLAVGGRRESKLKKELNELLEEHLATPESLFEKRKWLVSSEKKTAILLDASEFYGKLDVLNLREDARVRLAFQLALDTNKCAANVLRSEGRYGKFVKVSFGDIERAREITGARRMMKPAEYVDSQVSFLVKAGELNERKGGEVTKIAKETLARYEERKRNPISYPLAVSAVAVYNASYKAGSPMSAWTFKRILKVSQESMREVGDELIQIARPDEFAEWKRMKKDYRGPRESSFSVY
jgi:hypothetical protein